MEKSGMIMVCLLVAYNMGCSSEGSHKKEDTPMKKKIKEHKINGSPVPPKGIIRPLAKSNAKSNKKRTKDEKNSQ